MLKKTIASGAVILAFAFGALLAQDKGKGGAAEALPKDLGSR